MAHDDIESDVEIFRRSFIPAAVATLQAQGHIPTGLGVDAAMVWLAAHRPDASNWILRRIEDVRMMSLTARYAGKATPAHPREYGILIRKNGNG